MDAGKIPREQAIKYEGATIGQIRRGKGHRSKYIYAKIFAKDGEVLVSADLEYCVQRMTDASQYFEPFGH